ncbi:hypothetical protein B14_200054 (plasmid) [Bacillus licheniformis]|uniref:hypothetical protein n=1 Tax=Bacillus licheniformis TaxID=1402 RepID=UPI0009B75AC3|nr:hypothetical protein [Bacillus licheniformis]ARC67265.1 hypothetical protein B14_200054 [Bacillus licheniformis]ARW46093.1 hypothetical protein S100141_04873 [Bacillus licheniformis]MDE1421920.1 hypothetical protein [Bacillus licheniformis]MEC0475925.1 hypothetical protein [Bacillus licheniformis]QAS18750.1 hypothetical protein EQJ69_22770 [Bacillus licheniformis]
MNTDFIYCSVMTKDEETFTTGILTKKIPRIGETLWIDGGNRDRTICKVIDVCHWVIHEEKYQNVALYVEVQE